VTTSSSKPSEVVITTVGRGAFFLPNHITFVLEVFRTRLRAKKTFWTLRKLCRRAFNTKPREGPSECKTIICIKMDERASHCLSYVVDVN
jgi:hypothetical protein